MQFPLRISRHTEPRVAASHLIEALAAGEKIVSCNAYGRGSDPVLHKIDVLVKAELPAVNCDHGHLAAAERLWLWSLGELKSYAYLPGKGANDRMG